MTRLIPLCFVLLAAGCIQVAPAPVPTKPVMKAALAPDARGVRVENGHAAEPMELSVQVNDEAPFAFTLKPGAALVVYEERSAQLPAFKKEQLNGVLLDADGKELSRGGSRGCTFTLGTDQGVGVAGNLEIKDLQKYLQGKGLEARKYKALERVEITVKKGPADPRAEK
jgi:hypothetical protein